MERRLVRPRLISRLAAAVATGTALVSGPHGAGKSTLVRTWAQREGAELVWFDATHALGPAWDSVTTALRAGSRPVAAVLRGRTAQDGELLDELRQLQIQHPALQVILLRGLGMSITSGEPELRLGSVITARELAFTSAEIVQLGELEDTQIDDATARVVLEHTGGYALAVEAVVHAIHRAGHVTSQLLDETTDLLMGAVAHSAGAGALSAEAWDRMLRTAIPDSLSLAQLGGIWDTGEPERMVRLLEGSGLVQVVGRDGEPHVVLVPALRAGLRRRLYVELTRAQLVEAVCRTARWLDEHDDFAGAVELLHQYGLVDQLADWLRSRWQELPRVPAGRVRELLGSLPAGPHLDERLLVAHARALVDILHAGHDGLVSPQNRRRAAAMLDLVADVEGAPERSSLVAAVRGVRAALARMAGEHQHAFELHDLAAKSLPPAESRGLHAWLHGQSALTAISAGDLHRAGADLERALDLPPGGHDDPRVLLLELDRLVQGYLGTLHPSDDGTQHGPRAQEGLAGSIGALADTSRLIAQLDVTGAWDALHRMPVATGMEDPAALPVLRAQAEAMAHLLSGIPNAGLGALDVIDALLAGRTLSTFESTMLRNTRAEVLVALDEPAAALAVLDHGNPPAGLVSTLVRCVVLLALGRPQEAADLVSPLLPAATTWASNYPTWMLIVSSLVFDDLGDRDRADQLLGRGLAIASRSGAMLPFARQGPLRMAQLIERARELRVDPASRALLDQLDVAREQLRLSSVQARLSDRELIVLQHLRETGASRRLAALLHVSPNTVKSQLQSIYRKLGASTRVEALRAATLLGLLDDEVTT